MIQITIQTKNHKIESIIVEGHSNYDVIGQDIVCASVSVLTISIFNGITEICKIKKAKVFEGDGYLKLELPNDLTKEEENNTNILLKTLFLAYRQLIEIYPDEIKLLLR